MQPTSFFAPRSLAAAAESCSRRMTYAPRSNFEKAGSWRSLGAANRIRTCDPVITNDVLYQLSYCGGPCGAVRRGPKTPAPDIGQRRDFARKRRAEAVPRTGVPTHRQPQRDRKPRQPPAWACGGLDLIGEFVAPGSSSMPGSSGARTIGITAECRTRCGRSSWECRRGAEQRRRGGGGGFGWRR